MTFGVRGYSRQFSDLFCEWSEIFELTVLQTVLCVVSHKLRSQLLLPEAADSGLRQSLPPVSLYYEVFAV